MGHEVVRRSDGAVAWDILQSPEAPRLAILYLTMPELVVITVCRHVRQDHNATSIYIILLTARSSKPDIVAGLEAGADDYVTKPFDADELHARVKVGIRMVELQLNLAQRVVELEEAQETLRNLSLTDDLTGLYNRRGFFTLADQHLKTARRAKRQTALILLIWMTSKAQRYHGHREGSNALRKSPCCAALFAAQSDSAYHGDEFDTLETYAKQNEPKAALRAQDNLRQRRKRATTNSSASFTCRLRRRPVNDTTDAETA